MADYTLKEGAKKVAAKSKTKTKSSRNWMIFWLVLSLILFTATALIAAKHQLNGWQLKVFRYFNDVSLGSGFVTFAKWLTEGLGSGYPIAVCVIVPLLFKKYRIAWRFFVIVGGAGALSEIVKYLVKEPRPIAMLHGNLHQRVIETGPGFPSGHQTVATAMAITLWFLLPAKWRWLSIVWIAAVGWSRLFLGVHTPVDILGGFACGMIAVCVVRLLPKSIAKPLRLNQA